MSFCIGWSVANIEAIWKCLGMLFQTDGVCVKPFDADDADDDEDDEDDNNYGAVAGVEPSFNISI